MSNQWDPAVLRAKHTAIFWSNVIVNEHGCWDWMGVLHPDGYPYTNWKCHSITGKLCKRAKAHVVSYCLHNDVEIDDIPRDPTNPRQRLSILHSCNNKTCCNPEHLRMGTHVENMEDLKKSGTQHDALKRAWVTRRARMKEINHVR
jgi:hypothetical protein